MIVQAIKTRKVTAQCCTLLELVDESLQQIGERTIVVIASKVVSLCEGGVVPVGSIDKHALIAKYATYYLPPSTSRYDVSFTITEGQLMPSAGIDESNADGEYILWPRDAQRSANEVRAHLMKKYDLRELGVIITDSTTRPFQWGTTGIGVAYSGFAPLKSYIGTPDLFGRDFVFHKNNIMNGLAAAAVVLMGEGAEQTPLATIEDIPFVQFQPNDPNAKELADLVIAPEDDLYAPFFKGVEWIAGQDGKPE
jgi:dihydrofolate synthase / folylpolyglutamate synthase